MEQRLSLVTLGVADLTRSRRFYEALGWKPAGIGGGGEVYFFQLGGIVMGLWGRESLAADANLSPQGSGFGGIALAYNTRTRDEVDAVLAEAEQAGGRILKQGHDAFWGGYTGYFADPDGHPWEVAWNPGFALAEDGSVTLPE